MKNFKWTEGVVLKSDNIAFFRLQNYKDFLNPPNFLRKIFLFFCKILHFFTFLYKSFLPQNNSKLLLRARLPSYSYICWHFFALNDRFLVANSIIHTNISPLISFLLLTCFLPTLIYITYWFNEYYKCIAL